MPTPVQLPGSCDIRNVTQLYASFAAAFAQGAPVVVDASAVEQCDTAGAQLLVAVAREPNVTWRLSNALRAHLAELALAPVFFSEEKP